MAIRCLSLQVLHALPIMDDPLHWAVLGWDAALDELIHSAVKWLSLQVLHVLPALDDTVHRAVLG